MEVIEKAGISVEELNKMFGGQYESNKGDEMRQVESGGWIVAWGREINERDAADGVVAAGVSIFSGGSTAYMWAQRLVLESLEKMGSSMIDAGTRLGDEARDRMTKVALQVISDALRAEMPKFESINFGKLEVKAGLMKYSGTNSFQLLGGERTTVSKTWGFIPYVAARIAATASDRDQSDLEIRHIEITASDRENYNNGIDGQQIYRDNYTNNGTRITIESDNSFVEKIQEENRLNKEREQEKIDERNKVLSSINDEYNRIDTKKSIDAPVATPQLEDAMKNFENFLKNN